MTTTEQQHPWGDDYAFDSGQVQSKIEPGSPWGAKKIGEWVGYARGTAKIYADANVPVKVVLTTRRTGKQSSGALYPSAQTHVAEYIPGRGWVLREGDPEQDGWIQWSYGQQATEDTDWWSRERYEAEYLTPRLDDGSGRNPNHPAFETRY